MPSPPVRARSALDLPALLAADFDADIFSKIKDLHTVANLVKRFIREVPAALLTQDQEDRMRAAMGTDCPDPIVARRPLSLTAALVPS